MEKLGRGHRAKQGFPWLGADASVALVRMGNPVELRVGGQNYRVVASADEAELQRLAGVVDARLRSLSQPNRQISPQALVLAAIALAHDLEEERAARRRAEDRSKQMLRALLQRIDAVLDEGPVAPEDGESAEGPRRTDSGGDNHAPPPSAT